ncbi:clavesin-1-like [Maniola jurtina]|uniref:clavesin-1-like n=1 Tax=Maniola jurtina TaxID=191418 RepID=UPI001E68C600|nr:clavesin-1-like [Maniola jurtina]XP_045770430.1 clavesin-1-like [Maniola jurtina]XP_045770431.1 clavesin-1-like [Maniola jurtina]XP_045770432.1 clavesin-1-like [Maniola jurtina]
MLGAVQPFLIEKEYEKNPDILQDDIQKIKEWLKTQPHLPGELLTDLDLIIAFHSCDNSVQVTKQVLDLHYTLRTLFTALFKDRDVDQRIISTMNTTLLAPLPMPTVKGYRAVFCGILDPDARLFNFPDVIRTTMMVIDLWQYAEGTWPGFVIIIDMNQATLAHIAKLDIMTLRQTLYFLQECMLVRLKEVHFINAPSFMDKLMMLLKPFMKKSLLDMIHIHETGSQELYKYIPKKAFPKDLGGDYKSKKDIGDDLIHWLQDNKSFYIEENKRRVNESLRPDGKKTTIEDLFSIQGSFKKLDID